jgi:hypothetical protein
MATIAPTFVPRPDLGVAVMQEDALLDGFVAHRVFPNFPVGVSTATIPKILARRNVMRLWRAKHGEFPRNPISIDAGSTFACKEAGFEEAMDAQDIEALGGVAQAEMVATAKAVQTLLRAKDNVLSTLLMTTGTFGSGYNTAGAAAWDNASGKPIDDIVKASEQVRKRIGRRPNKVLFSGGAYSKLLQNAQVQSQVKAVMGYTDKMGGISALITPATLAAAFGLEEVIIGEDVKNTADEGLTETLASTWSDTNALVFYAPKAGMTDLVSPGLGRTFVWDPGLKSNADGVSVQTNDTLRGMQVEVYDTTSKLHVVRPTQYLDILLLNKDAGHLITGV